MNEGKELRLHLSTLLMFATAMSILSGNLIGRMVGSRKELEGMLDELLAKTQHEVRNAAPLGLLIEEEAEVIRRVLENIETIFDDWRRGLCIDRPA